ncbi:MAG: Uma2 family endonuclease [Pyrinomonadaceae bacterium]
MSVQIDRRIFSVDDFYRMVEVGLLREDERVELIEGELIRMSPIGSRHAGCVMRLNALFSQRAGGAAIVLVQSPVRLSDLSEPQPDVALLKPRAHFYAARHPTPADALLIVEVADTTIGYDRVVKVPLYARAGVPEVWVVDLENEVVETHAQPREGEYASHERAVRGGTFECLALEGARVAVDDILG